MKLILVSLYVLVILFGLLNLLRMTFFMVGSDIYGLKNLLRKRKKSLSRPLVSVVIPAYNEEKSIINCVYSVLMSDYPADLLEIIVINDGSKDRTAERIGKFIRAYPGKNVRLVSQD